MTECKFPGFDLTYEEDKDTPRVTVRGIEFAVFPTPYIRPVFSVVGAQWDQKRHLTEYAHSAGDINYGMIYARAVVDGVLPAVDDGERCPACLGAGMHRGRVIEVHECRVGYGNDTTFKAHSCVACLGRGHGSAGVLPLPGWKRYEWGPDITLNDIPIDPGPDAETVWSDEGERAFELARATEEYSEKDIQIWVPAIAILQEDWNGHPAGAELLCVKEADGGGFYVSNRA